MTRRGAAIFLVVAAGLLGALGPVAPAGAFTRDVEIRDTGFGGTAKIAPGDTVRWTNADSFKHTVTAEDRGQDGQRLFDSGDLYSGDVYSHTFTEPGTYRYFCRQHTTMKSEVVVEGAGPPATTSSSTTTTTPAPTTTTTTAIGGPAPEPSTTTTTGRSAQSPTPTSPTTTSPTPTSPAPKQPVTTNGPSSTTTTAAPSTTAPSTSSSSSSSSTSSSTSSSSTSSTTATTAPAGTGVASAGNVGPPAEGEPDDPVPEALQATQASRSAESGSMRWATALVVALMLASGAFGIWSLWRLRPGKAV